jgi:hypothetical protein
MLMIMILTKKCKASGNYIDDVTSVIARPSGTGASGVEQAARGNDLRDAKRRNQ